MAITGAHALLHTSQPDEVGAIPRDLPGDLKVLLHQPRHPVAAEL